MRPRAGRAAIESRGRGHVAEVLLEGSSRTSLREAPAHGGDRAIAPDREHPSSFAVPPPNSAESLPLYQPRPGRSTHFLRKMAGRAFVRIPVRGGQGARVHTVAVVLVLALCGCGRCDGRMQGGSSARAGDAGASFRPRPATPPDGRGSLTSERADGTTSLTSGGERRIIGRPAIRIPFPSFSCDARGAAGSATPTRGNDIWRLPPAPSLFHADRSCTLLSGQR